MWRSGFFLPLFPGRGPDWVKFYNFGSERGYHYFGSARIYYRMGKAFAEGMMELLGE